MSRRARQTRLPSALLICLLIAVAIVPAGDSLSAATTTHEDILNEVSGNRIMDTIRDLQAFGTRAFTVNKSNEAASYLHDRMGLLGLDVEYQEFVVGAHPAKNVIGTLNGSDEDAEHLFLFGAHYDSENAQATSLSLAESLPAPGADDDASGIAVMLEIATVLHKYALNHTVRFVAFGAEEAGYDYSGGLKGSTHFVAQEKARNASYASTVILDMVGYRGEDANHAIFLSNDGENAMAGAAMAAASRYDLNITVNLIVNPLASYSDHYSFWVAGYPSICAMEEAPHASNLYQFNPYYHSQYDTVDWLSEEQMTQLTKALVGGILALNGLSQSEETQTLPMTVAVVAVVAITIAPIMFYAYLRRRKV